MITDISDFPYTAIRVGEWTLEMENTQIDGQVNIVKVGNSRLANVATRV